jgi:hypothetical protein
MKTFCQRPYIIFVFSMSLAFVPLLASLTALTALTSAPASAAAPIAKDKIAKGKRIAQSKVAKKSAPKAEEKSDEDRAIDLVWRRTEVKAWLKLFAKGTSKLGGHAAASADHDQGDLWSVHVYEDLPDRTATFNWYDVNVKTGKVSKKAM